MISYEIYKLTHILSFLFIFIGLAAYIYSHKKIFALFHGLGLALLLVTGFGLLARLGLTSGIPQWVWVKLGVWFLVGATYSVAKRKMLSPFFQITLWMILAGIAASMAIFKPMLF
ncbi:MAG TPA: hypothetical protein DCL41_05900 [Bdellovibrionales bacterium]|nr:hypothetical protein [Pseudobdellovibrionaceae bacterium]HAG91383.1 hypothetical protein [Bdellovibrionales bacterium]|tara:strand:+ start:722 stop:1066 length:345 start_codon:yes stop_codon:yes gene_type:complete